MSEWPESIRRYILPISPADPTTKPPEFGAPLRPIVAGSGNPFVDRVPAWVMIRRMFAQIKFTETWSTLDPDAQFTLTDLGRIKTYKGRVDWLGYCLRDPFVRPPSLTMSSLLFGEVCYLGHSFRRGPAAWARQAAYRDAYRPSSPKTMHPFPSILSCPFVANNGIGMI